MQWVRLMPTALSFLPHQTTTNDQEEFDRQAWQESNRMLVESPLSLCPKQHKIRQTSRQCHRVTEKLEQHNSEETSV